MTLRTTLGTVAVVLVGLLAAAGAGAAVRPVHPCGQTHAGGKAWAVYARTVSCGSARALIGKLGASMPAARGPRPGFHPYLSPYLGMRCYWGVEKGRNGINCYNLDMSKQVTAVRR